MRFHKFSPSTYGRLFHAIFFFDRRRGIIPIYDQENAQFTNLRKTATTTATTTTIVLRPLYRSTCVSRHLQNWMILLVENFTARVLLLKAMNQCILIGEKTLEFYSTVLFIGLHCLRTWRKNNYRNEKQRIAGIVMTTGLNYENIFNQWINPMKTAPFVIGSWHYGKVTTYGKVSMLIPSMLYIVSSRHCSYLFLTFIYIISLLST